MAETLGTLVDKLSVVNIKLFMVQDIVSGAADAGDGLDSETVRKLHALNKQRNQLMSEIDVMLKEAVRSGNVVVDPHIKLN